MALTFTGTLGLNTSAYCAGAQQFGGAGGFVPGYHITGLRFTVATNITLTELGWPLFGNNVASGQKTSPMNFGVWNEDGDLLVQAQVATTTPNWSTKIPLTVLTPGQTYTIAAQTSPNTFILNPDVVVRTRDGQNLTKDFTIVGTNTEPTDASELGQGDPDAVEVFRGIFSIKYIVESVVTQEIPPDPVVYSGGKQFLVTIRGSWMPSSVNEWTLQYSQSLDGVTWLDWKDLGTFSIYDTTYSHNDLDPFDKPFYRYRYKVASIVEESDWSEVAYPGQVLNYVTSGSDDNTIDPGSIPSGSIDPSHLNITELSAISANIGTVTAGILRGPLIETSATNPRIALQQDVGLTATDGSGNTTFSLDAITGAATFKGSLTGSSFTTGTVDPRVVMDSTGIFAKNAAHADTFRIDAATGNVTVTGALTTGAGSVINASTITVGQLTASQIQTITLDAGNIKVGSTVSGAIQSGAIVAGNIATNALDAYIITTTAGGRIRTAATGSRVELGTSIVTSAGTKNGLVGVDGSNNITFFVDAATGAAQFKGQVLSGATGLGNFSDQITSSQIVLSTSAGSPNTLLVSGVSAGTIAAGSIAADRLVANSITTTQLSATAIDAMTITGATFQTASVNPRVIMDAAGFRAVNGAGVTVVNIPSSGNVELAGHVSAAGVDIQAGTTAAPPDDRKLRWLDASANWLRQDVTYYETAPSLGSPYTLSASNVKQINNASAWSIMDFSVLDRLSNTRATFGAQLAPGNISDVEIYAGVTAHGSTGFTTPHSIIIDSKNRSSYVQLANSMNPSAIRVYYVPNITVPSLIAGASSTTAVIDTTMSTPDPGGLALSFTRATGAFSSLTGSLLSWAYVVTVVSGTINIQFQFRNNSGTTSATASFGGIVYAGFA